MLGLDELWKGIERAKEDEGMTHRHCTLRLLAMVGNG